MNGWIKLHKSIMDHWLWGDPVVIKAWLDLLLSVNYMDKKVLFNGRLITVKKGQIITSIRKLTERWGCTRRKANNIITMFAEDGMIDIKRDKGGTLLTIVNYSIYQDVRDTDSTTESTTQDTTQGTTQSTQHKNIKNNKEYKKEREEPALPPAKIHRHKTGKYENVYLSNEEASKLVKEFGEVMVSSTIESLSEYIKTHKTNYQDDGHYALICKWIREDKRKNPGKEEEEYNARQREAIRKSCEIGIG